MIVGPTAGGKTALSIALAAQLGNAEVVSADSMQVYRGMDIGTAKPSAAEQARVPHHLIDIVDPHSDDFTLAQWLRRARESIEQIHARGHIAIVVGGTNLYVRALLEGIAETPVVSAELRAEVASLTTEAARAQLERIDPVSAERIHPSDRRRTLRSIEIHRVTGRIPSSVREQWSDAPRPLPSGSALIGLEWAVPAINARINERVRGMFSSGLVEEVRRLLARGALSRQAIEAVGYREVAEHLSGARSLEHALEQTKIRSRRLGKQQRTWLRRFRLVPGSLWLPGDSGVEALVQAVIEACRIRT